MVNITVQIYVNEKISNIRDIETKLDLKETIDELYETYYREKFSEQIRQELRKEMYQTVEEEVKDDIMKDVNNRVCDETGCEDIDGLFECFRDKCQVIEDVKDLVRYE